MGAVGRGRQLVQTGIDKAISVNMPLVDAYVARAKRTRPDASPGRSLALDRQYTAAVSTLGAAAGATAAVPVVTMGPALAVNVAEVGGFLQATAVYVFALATVHGVEIDDLERRRTLLLGVLGGNSASSFIEKAAGRTGPHWAKAIISRTPMTAINRINKALGRRFVTKAGTSRESSSSGGNYPSESGPRSEAQGTRS